MRWPQWCKNRRYRNRFENLASRALATGRRRQEGASIGRESRNGAARALGSRWLRRLGLFPAGTAPAVLDPSRLMPMVLVPEPCQVRASLGLSAKSCRFEVARTAGLTAWRRLAKIQLPCWSVWRFAHLTPNPIPAGSSEQFLALRRTPDRWRTAGILECGGPEQAKRLPRPYLRCSAKNSSERSHASLAASSSNRGVVSL